MELEIQQLQVSPPKGVFHRGEGRGHGDLGTAAPSKAFPAIFSSRPPSPRTTAATSQLNPNQVTAAWTQQLRRNRAEQPQAACVEVLETKKRVCRISSSVRYIHRSAGKKSLDNQKSQTRKATKFHMTVMMTISGARTAAATRTCAACRWCRRW